MACLTRGGKIIGMGRIYTTMHIRYSLLFSPVCLLSLSSTLERNSSHFIQMRAPHGEGTHENLVPKPIVFLLHLPPIFIPRLLYGDLWREIKFCGNFPPKRDPPGRGLFRVCGAGAGEET